MAEETHSNHGLHQALGHINLFPTISGHNDWNVVEKGVPHHTFAHRAAAKAVV